MSWSWSWSWVSSHGFFSVLSITTNYTFSLIKHKYSKFVTIKLNLAIERIADSFDEKSPEYEEVIVSLVTSMCKSFYLLFLNGYLHWEFKHKYSKFDQINQHQMEFASALQLAAILIFSGRRGFIQRLIYVQKQNTPAPKKSQNEISILQILRTLGIEIYQRFFALFLEPWNLLCVGIFLAATIFRAEISGRQWEQQKIVSLFLPFYPIKSTITTRGTSIIQTFPLHCIIITEYLFLASFSYIKRSYRNWINYQNSSMRLRNRVASPSFSLMNYFSTTLDLIDYKKLNDGLFATLVLRQLFNRYTPLCMRMR